MTRQQQLIALHTHLCERTTLTNTICSGSYEIFKSLGMPDLALFQMKDLFFELDCMGLITAYQHHPGFLAGVINIWTCRVIKREFPHQLSAISKMETVEKHTF